MTNPTPAARLMPAEPTEEMLRAGEVARIQDFQTHGTTLSRNDARRVAGSIYRAMYAVVPASHAAPDDMTDAVSKALRRAWRLGQTYWQQADSESYVQHRRSDETQRKFDALVDETRALLTATPAIQHASDCAVHNMPAYPNGPCNCGAQPPLDATMQASEQDAIDAARYRWLRRRAIIVDYSNDGFSLLTLLKTDGPSGEFLDDWTDGEISAAGRGVGLNADSLAAAAALEVRPATVPGELPADSPPPMAPATNSGHGHVWARPDGMKVRCGGPGICPDCSRDFAAIAKGKAP